MAGTEALVAALTARLQPLETESNRAWWLASTQVSEAHERRRVAADLTLRDALGDVSAFRDVERARASAATPMQRRQLDVLFDRSAPNQVPPDLRAEITELEAQLDSTFNAFRGCIDGVPADDNTISEVLRRSDDPLERRQAWEASKEVGEEVAGRIRALVRLRNRAALALGHADFFTMSLATNEFDADRLFATLDDLDDASRETFATWKRELDASLAERFDCSPDELRPWHYDDPFFQSAPKTGGVLLDDWFADADLEALTVATYAGIGLDIRPALERSDLEPRDGKSQHAFCVDIDRAGDVRVLCNNVANEHWVETMLHEFGHACYDLGTDRELPWILRDMHALTTEGIAMMFGRLVRDSEWLTSIAAFDVAEIDALAPRLAATRRAGLLVFVRWVLVMTNFERALYAHPEADLDSLWWDLVERYQLVRRPEERRAADWAAKIHLAVAPVYYQNYLYGEMFASQLLTTLRREFGGVVQRPTVGTFLREHVFAPGLSVRWDELVERATGEPLVGRHLASELAGA